MKRLVTLLLLALVSGCQQQPPGPPGPKDPLQAVLEASAADREKARSLVTHGAPEKAIREAISLLNTTVSKYPEDAEAHILLSNANVLQSKKPHYRIPVITSSSGSDREGVQLLAGLALAQVQINESGGAAGHLICLDIMDCQSSSDKAIEFAKKIPPNPEYQVVLGPWSSGQVLASARWFEEGKIPVLSPSASDPKVREAGRHIFTASDSDDHRVQRIAEHLFASGWKNVAVFWAQDNGLSRSIRDEFVAAFTKLGGKVRTDERQEYVSDQSRFASQMEVLARETVDAVFLADYRSDQVLRITREIRTKYPQLPLASQAMLFHEATDAEGMITSTYFHHDANDPRIEEFTSKFNSRFGKLHPTHREANAYDSLMLIARAIDKVGYERKALTQYLHQVGEKLPPYQGVSGDFAPGRRLDLRKPYLVQMRNGEYVLLNQPTPTAGGTP